MEKLIKYVLWLIAIICLYAILHIGLGCFFAIGISDKYLSINQVFINLSYSYIAGVIFYLLTIRLPYRQRLNKLKLPISKKIRAIHGKIIDSAKCLYPMEEWNQIIFSENNLKQRFMNISINSQSAYSIAGINRTIIAHLIAQRNDIRILIKDLLGYKEYLSNEQLSIIEDINESDYFCLLNAFSITIMDNPSVRENLASELYKQIIISNKLLKTI